MIKTPKKLIQNHAKVGREIKCGVYVKSFAQFVDTSSTEVDENIIKGFSAINTPKT